MSKDSTQDTNYPRNPDEEVTIMDYNQNQRNNQNNQNNQQNNQNQKNNQNQRNNNNQNR